MENQFRNKNGVLHYFHLLIVFFNVYLFTLLTTSQSFELYQDFM